MFNRIIRDIAQNTLQNESTREDLIEEIAITALEVDELDELEKLYDIIKK